MKSLKDRVAVVTGAGSGIGKATAIELARKGAHVALADIKEEGIRATAKEIEALGRKTSLHVVDVADKKRWETFPGEVLKAHGKVNVIVNNAGVGVAASFENHTIEDWEWIVGINLWGVVYGCTFFLPHIKQAGEGHIVNISSLAGIVPSPTMPSYCATKFAVRGLTESMRPELAKLGIGVTSVHPGVINTNIPKATRFKGPKAEKLQAQGAALFERLGHPPEKVAKKIADGILKNKARVLIGPETYVFDAFKRALPVQSDRIISQLGFLGERR